MASRSYARTVERAWLTRVSGAQQIAHRIALTVQWGVRAC